MLYAHKLNLIEMEQINNWKKKENFNHVLLDVRIIELSTYEVDCKIEYKKIIPLNLFEKYSIKLIERAEEESMTMNINLISKLLHLDINLIKENLENLEMIGMLSGINGDFLTINRDENAEYLKFENKFKFKKVAKKYYLTEKEYDDVEGFIKKRYKNDNKSKTEDFNSIEELEAKKSIKKVKLLIYSENKFLIFGKNGINNSKDLKFINENDFNYKLNKPEDAFCHYDELLPLLKNELKNEKSIVFISSQDIDEKNLRIFDSIKYKYIFSMVKIKNDRIFQLTFENDFITINNMVYMKTGDFIFKSEDKKIIKEVKNRVKKYFLEKILDIDSNYSIEELNSLTQKINEVTQKIEEYSFSTKKEFDNIIKELSTKKNNLYGLISKNSRTRNSLRKKIDKYEENNDIENLKKYSEYFENREKIISIKIDIENKKLQYQSFKKLEKELNNLKSEKSRLSNSENKEKIKKLEKELDILNGKIQLEKETDKKKKELKNLNIDKKFNKERNVGDKETLKIKNFKNKPYIIDTNIFLSIPYILDLFKNQEIIIPQKVLDELDGLKKGNNKKNASEAIRNIDNFNNKEKLSISPSYINELSDDFNKKSPDNLILSIVLKYDGILLTNDRGLKVKCNSLNLEVKSLDGFQNDSRKKSQKKDININLSKQIFDYIKNNDLNEIKRLINQNIDINFYDKKGFTPLIFAIRMKKYQIIETLLKYKDIDIDKVDRNKLKMPPFAHATQKRDLKIMKLLYENGAKIYLGVKGKNEGNTPLLIAAWDGCLKCIEFILSTDEVSINSMDNNGFTALIKASIRGHFNIVEYLLKNNVDIKIRDKKHKRALDYAKEKKHFKIIKILEGVK